MAASLSRPDPSSPASVAEAGFSTSRRGFSQDEVRAFLTSVAAELTRLQERERELEAQLQQAEAEVVATPDLDDETVAAILGEETLRVLQTARESASQIKIRAEETAAKVISDANDEINRLRQEAEVEVARKRHDASSDAEAEVALAKQQGREMVNEARAYRERVLADLERRTKLARQQIEDLVHGRDRLLQVFERARLVAVDVTTELQSIAGPDEIVNLAPTTGPLPLMVPAGEIDRAAARPVVGDRMADAAEISHRHDEVASLQEPPAEADAAADDESAAADPAEVAAADEPQADVEAPVESATGEADVDETADDETADDDTEPVDDESGADTGDDTDGADTEGARIEGADVDAADDIVEMPRDANVVSLFRGRPAGEAEDEAEEGADDGADDAERPDVNGIFERLRAETPGGDETGADTADATADAAADAPPASTAFSHRDEALVPLIVSGARKLKRVLADEQNGVLDLLRRGEPVTELDELVPDVDAHVASYLDALADDLLDAAVAGAGQVGRSDTKTLRTQLRRGDALDRARVVLGEDLVGPLRQRLERAIADGAGDNDDVTKRVRAVYREWKTQHIDDQLDDAFRFAYGGGMAVGVKEGTPLTWTIDPSEPCGPDCEDNSLAGAVPAGEAFPTGHLAAPAHPGCRCLTLPGDQ